MRPRQWVKNVLVAAAPLAAGRLFEVNLLADTLLAFAVFCCAASGIYLVNDARDADSDRRHPEKRHRPVAAGVVSKTMALTLGCVLLAIAISVAAVASNPALTAVIATYAVLQLGYCFFLKHQPVLDLAVVASGFLLRATAGGAAAKLPLSQWFLLVAGFGSLFMVAGKRYSELRLVAATGAKTRASLEEYSESYLRFVWTLSAALAVMAYSLWAFDLRAPGAARPWSALSIAPFVIAILRYAVDIDKGTAGAPEDIVLRDRVLQGLGLLWLILIGLAVFHG